MNAVDKMQNIVSRPEKVKASRVNLMLLPFQGDLFLLLCLFHPLRQYVFLCQHVFLCLLVFQQIADFHQEFLLIARFRSLRCLGRLGLLFLLLCGKFVHHFNQHEHAECHDEEVEGGLDEVTIINGSLPNAPPMMTPTAMSSTFPRMANCLNSFKNLPIISIVFFINTSFLQYGVSTMS